MSKCKLAINYTIKWSKTTNEYRRENMFANELASSAIDEAAQK